MQSEGEKKMQRFTKIVYIFSLVAVLFYSSLILADSITVTNPSFELPGVGKIKGWNGEGVAGTPAVDIPGWASDHRIFTTLNLEFNYLIPLKFSPFTFEKGLLTAIKEYNTKRFSLFGWSLGGFVGSEFASRHSDLIDEIILVSIRRRYKAKELTEIKRHLNKSKKGCRYNR